MKHAPFLRAFTLVIALCLLCFTMIPAALADSEPVASFSYQSNTAVVSNPNSVDRLNLRASPNTSAVSLGRYYNGTVVEILREYVNGPDWWQVQIGQTIGYMQSKYLVRGGEGAVISARPQAKITGSVQLNLRSRADINSKSITMLNPGLIVTVLGDAGTWYHVIAGNTIGYVNIAYASILYSGTGGGSNGSVGGGNSGNTGSIGGSNSFNSLPNFPSTRKVGRPTAAGLSVPVYSSPSQFSVRGANGRASVGMDSTFYVYGSSNWEYADQTSYMLIAYTLTAGGNRIGWVNGNSIINETLPVNLDLQWGNVQAVTIRQCNVTDDPMVNQAVLLSLPWGSNVTALAKLSHGGTMWIYVDGVSSQGLFRGFITADALLAH